MHLMLFHFYYYPPLKAVVVHDIDVCNSIFPFSFLLFVDIFVIILWWSLIDYSAISSTCDLFLRSFDNLLWDLSRGIHLPYACLPNFSIYLLSCFIVSVSITAVLISLGSVFTLSFSPLDNRIFCPFLCRKPSLPFFATSSGTSPYALYFPVIFSYIIVS